MKKSALLYTLALFLGVKTTFAQNQAAATPQSKPIALTGATIHTAAGPVIENGVIVFDKGYH
jgi:hypothetical protein